MRHLVRSLIVPLVLLSASVAAFASLDLTGVSTERFATWYETMSPTAQGDGFLPGLESGKSVQIRYALPKRMPISFQADLHNIVAFGGGGEYYQLTVRRDSPTGAVLYQGPALADDPSNTSHHEPLEIASHLTKADIARGWIDLFASVQCKGDLWTMYRDAKGGKWDLRARAIMDSPSLRKAALEADVLRRSGLELLPKPQQITPGKRGFIITPKARILLSAGAGAEDVFAAELLRDEIRRVSGFSLPIRKGLSGARAGDLLLEHGKSPKGEQSYQLATNGRFRAVAGDSTGLFYAAQTAIQLLHRTGNRAEFRGATIVDWPSIRYRMFQYDIARFQTVNVAHCKRVIREMARFKLNQLMFYMEDDYKYSKYPFAGRPGTFTPENVRELVAYARKYHVELVPQLESLGHAWSLLHHPEMADLRENGNTWVFCTSNPKTWQVLDDMIGELARAFNNTKFIHVGCDEFEDEWMGFGKCPQCVAAIEKIGRAGLYAEHMRRLNAIAKKHGRKLIFWTAHGGDRPETRTLLTLDAVKQLPKDIIPMEWVYNAPRDYVTFDQYCDAGFSQVYVAPTILGYGGLYPDCETNLRNIEGFYRAGAKRNALGGCTCTWEMTYGSQFETSWYGMIYSAQCGWNATAGERHAFDRAFAAHWLGLSPADGKRVGEIFRLQPNDRGWSLLWLGPRGAGPLFWIDPARLRQKAGSRWDAMLKDAPGEIQDCEQFLAAINQLKGRAGRNRETLDAVASALRMHRSAGRKLLAMERAGRYYQLAQAARQRGSAEADQFLQQAALSLKPLQADYRPILADLELARDSRGGCPEDVDRLKSLAGSLDRLISQIEALRGASAAPLPEPAELGFALKD